MILNKNQIESVRYQLKKNNTSATNEDIRKVAEKFKEFDAILIAESIMNSQNQEIIPYQSLQTDDNSLTLYDDKSKKSSLTLAEKKDIIKLKSIDLGIDLSSQEILKITQLADRQITDSLEYLDNIGLIIAEFFQARNKQTQENIELKIEGIKTIINSNNEHLADIFNQSNKIINDLVDDCVGIETDYKSAYTSKIENIRKVLKI